MTTIGADGGERRRQVLGRVGLAQRAADGAAVAHDRVGDHPLGVDEDREVLGRRAATSSSVGVAGHRADAQLVAVDADVGQLGEVVDVDEHLGPGQAELHHRQQAVAAGDQPGLGAVPFEQGDARGRRWWPARTRTVLEFA